MCVCEGDCVCVFVTLFSTENSIYKVSVQVRLRLLNCPNEF